MTEKEVMWWYLLCIIPAVVRSDKVAVCMLREGGDVESIWQSKRTPQSEQTAIPKWLRILAPPFFSILFALLNHVSSLYSLPFWLVF
jgi:hypothetical protein